MKKMKKIEYDGIISRIKEDANVAVMVYNSNPGKRTLAYIFQLNPDAGELIAENHRSKERSEIMSTGTI